MVYKHSATADVADLLQQALKDLARKNGKQWFTQRDIARQLNVASGRLNDTRKQVLERLATMGQVEFRYRPNDARKTHEYRPVKSSRSHNRVSPSPEKSKMTYPDKDDVIFLEDSFYTSLYAYFNRSLPVEERPPHNMQYVPNDLSAEGWLDEARQQADRLKTQYQIDRCHEIDQVVAWVASKDFQRAYEFLVQRKQRVWSALAAMES